MFCTLQRASSIRFLICNSNSNFILLFMLLSPTDGGGIIFSGRPLSVLSISRIPLLSEGILMNPATNIHHVSGNC